MTLDEYFRKDNVISKTHKIHCTESLFQMHKNSMKNMQDEFIYIAHFIHKLVFHKKRIKENSIK